MRSQGMLSIERMCALAGVSRAEVSLEKGEAAVSYDEAQLSRDALVQAVDDAGFEAS